MYTSPTTPEPTPPPPTSSFECAGRTWELRLTVASLTEVRKASGVELNKALTTERGFAEMLFGDPETIAQVLWTLVEQQATAAGVTPEQFAGGLDGRTIERATEALLVAIADFMPRSKIGHAIRTNLRAVLAAADAAAIAAIEKRIDDK